MQRNGDNKDVQIVSSESPLVICFIPVWAGINVCIWDVHVNPDFRMHTKDDVCAATVGDKNDDAEGGATQLVWEIEEAWA